MDWLPIMQIGENPPPSSTTTPPPIKQSSLPITLSTTNIQQKIEAKEIELPTSTVHLKPPYSYVTLIRQAILGASMQRMTLNQIYKWIVDSYPYFRTAPPKWKV
jgi:forkhead transcription factor HCM1